MSTFVRVHETFKLLNSTVAASKCHDVNDGRRRANDDDYEEDDRMLGHRKSTASTDVVDEKGNSFHAVLHARRVDARLSISALAQAVGMDDAKVAAIERGDEVPSDEMAIRLMAAL